VVVDLLLVLAGGVLGGRALHVLANWAYFQNAFGEALRLNGGGLDCRRGHRGLAGQRSPPARCARRSARC